MENPVKYFFLLANIILTVAYTLAWKQSTFAPLFGFESAFSFHLATIIPSILIHFFADLAVIFYFVGTGVWIKEQAYQVMPINKNLAENIYEIFKKANRLKGRAMPFATFCIFWGILAFVMGGAIDVGALPWWIHPTMATMMLLAGWIGVPFIFSAIHENYKRLNEVSELVEK